VKANVSCLGLLAVLLASACVRPLPGEEPPPGARLYYPSRMATSPAQDKVYVVNANFDQRFSAGWVTQIDVAALLGAAGPGGASHDAQRAAMAEPLKVPALGGQIVVSPDGARAYLPHRGTGVLTTLDLQVSRINGVPLSCGDPNDRGDLSSPERRTHCDRAHMLRLTAARPSNLPGDAFVFHDYEDPYAAALARDLADPNRTLLCVGYLGSRFVSVFDVSAPVPKILRNIVVGNSAAVVSLTANRNDGRVFGTSHQAAGFTDRSVVYGIDVAKSLREERDAVLRADLNADVGGQDITALAFSQSATRPRAYVTNRAPDSVVALALTKPRTAFINAQGETEPGETEVVSVRSVMPVDKSQLTDIVYLPRPAGDLLVAASLLQDVLYFFDPADDRLQLVYRMKLPEGQMGPFAMQHVRLDGRDLLFVSTFFSHGLVVMDVSSSSFVDFNYPVSYTETEKEVGVASRHR
jgi:hypothetical protein